MITAIITSSFIISAIIVFFAILMVIADKTIGNYGEKQITVNGDKKYTVEGGKPLLFALRECNIFIPSACGGRGSCGLCEVKVLKGAGDYLATETAWITPEKQKKNIRLSCQVKVKQDMEVEIPEELLFVKEFFGVVESIVDLTYDIKQVRIRLNEPKKIEFRPGAFVQIETPEYELTNDPVYRAYSIASSPYEDNIVELEIRLVPNGICTTFVHKYLKEGDPIKFNGPYGEFYLRDSEAEIIFIAGGSGMAPIKSILLYMEKNQISRKATYFFGARTAKDLFLVDEMKKFEQTLPNFKFVPALSEPMPTDNWKGEVGLITETVDKYIKDGENKEGYLCGSPGMLKACTEVLTKKGVPREKVYFDSFG